MDYNVLLVDDEEDLLDLMSIFFRDKNFVVSQATSVDQAKQILHKFKIDFVFSDIRIPKVSGIELLKYVRQEFYQTPIVMVSGFSDYLLEDIMDLGGQDLFIKPADYSTLVQAVERSLAHLNDRFNQRREIHAELKLDPRDIKWEQVGSGGCYLPLETGFPEPGELIDFHFNVEGTELIGQGACRWVRTRNKPNGMAIEFHHLEAPGRHQYENYLKANRPQAHIPKMRA